MRVPGGFSRLLETGGVERVLGWTERRSRWPADRLAVLTYHRIDRPTGDGRYAGLVSATPETFETHVETLAARYALVSIDDVLAAIAGDRRLPERAVLLTFDDAVSDFEDHALPVLHRAGAPAVVFVPTGFVGRPDAVFWWDALSAATTLGPADAALDTPAGQMTLGSPTQRTAAYRALRDRCVTMASPAATAFALELCERVGVDPPPAGVMGWDSLRRLEASGIRCCAHTRGHVHLDHLGPDEVRAEVVGSLDDLRRELGDTAPAFAYPAGRLSEEVVEAVAGSGVQAAFTTRRGANVIGTTNPLLLNRVNVSPRTGLPAARAQLVPAMDRFFARRA